MTPTFLGLMRLINEFGSSGCSGLPPTPYLCSTILCPAPLMPRRLRTVLLALCCPLEFSQWEVVAED